MVSLYDSVIYAQGQMKSPTTDAMASSMSTSTASNASSEANSDDDTMGSPQAPASLPDSLSDDTESSFGGDYVGAFRSYLQGKESVEDTRRRVIVSRAQRHELNAQRARKEGLLSNHKNMGSSSRSALRILLVDIPLALVMATFILAWLVRDIYTEFYEPLIQRARRTDDQLLEEFTYYERQCTLYDLSTRNVTDIMVDTTDPHVVPTAVSQMLQHGAIVIPSLLSPSTVVQLRDYIVRKNQAISDAEKYPMSQGHRRLSYGIDAAEDPAVSMAIREVAHHPILRPLIATLLGDVDPASAEITSITAYDGASNQAWHQDTKQDGNALKFARTYSHSYSLFLPLQNVTEQMGATDICPGTHYCANDIADMCEETKIGLHLVGADQTFPAGAGALLNQHVWHRGGAHTDPNAPERIVFIVSFLARPNFEVDPRQLSRGTYFHQKWNMWGHTWKDLLAPESNMRQPFSLLRCLSLWKPSHSNWGYDLITSGFMRFANEQLEADDFAARFLPRLDQIGFPQFLRGRHLEEALQIVTWTIFIRETIQNVYNFAYKLNLVVHATYFGLVLAVVLWCTVRWDRRSGLGVLRSTTLRVSLTHCVLLMGGFELWRTVRQSPWARSVSTGRALMRPFPPQRNATSGGLTTMPTRWDVLIGTRFDADFLGSYNHWLDYHPGNLQYRDTVSNFAPLYTAAQRLDPRLSWSIAQRVVEQAKARDGRFLLQDYRNGDWSLLSEEKALVVVAGDLVKKCHPVVATVSTPLNRLIAWHRFGPHRSTVMAGFSLLQLGRIQEQMLGVDDAALSHTIKSSSLTHRRTLAVPLSTQPVSTSNSRSIMPSLKEHVPSLQAGSLVWATFVGLDEYFPGTVIRQVKPDWFDIAFDDNTREIVHVSNVTKFQAVTENDRVEGCFQAELEDCFPGIIRRVLPGGHVSIDYDDGTFTELVPPDRYFVPPFVYTGPHYP